MVQRPSSNTQDWTARASTEQAASSPLVSYTQFTGGGSLDLQPLVERSCCLLGLGHTRVNEFQ